MDYPTVWKIVIILNSVFFTINFLFAVVTGEIKHAILGYMLTTAASVIAFNSLWASFKLIEIFGL